MKKNTHIFDLNNKLNVIVANYGISVVTHTAMNY